MKHWIQRSAYWLALTVLLSACGGGSSPSTADVATPPVKSAPEQDMPTTGEVLRKVYDPNYSVPDGFFVDERASTPQSYTVYHVKDPSVSYELCTDDFSTAATWEDADNTSRQVNGYYVGHTENERYFEFVRELSYGNSVGNIDDLTSPGFSRVFKCSYATRDGVDRSLLSGYAGKINARPLSSEVLREYVEYLWQFTFFNVSAKSVLESYGTDSADALQRTLLLGFATLQGADQCDLVEVIEWTFSADLLSGEVVSQFDPVLSFQAELRDGVPAVCNTP